MPLLAAYLSLATSQAQPAFQATHLQSIELKLEDAIVDGGRVHFRPCLCDLQPAPSTEKLQEMIMGDTPGYWVYADQSKTEFISWGYFVYEFYVIPKAMPQGGGSACVFRVQAAQSGSFVDQAEDVSFSVGSCTEGDKGNIRILLHPTSYSKAILRYQIPIDPHQLPGEVQQAGLCSETRIYVSIENPLPAVQVELTGSIRPTKYNPEYWRGPPTIISEVQPTGKGALGPGRKLDLTVVLQPDAWHALGASVFPLGPGMRHDTILLDLDYNAPGGVPATLPIEIPVRFKPSFWGLLLTVVIGTVVGSSIGWCLPEKAPKNRIIWYKALAAALATAIIAECIGLLVFGSGKSEFKIFEFQIS
jgi:hypothetical protein